jgi:hypothetical protein
MTSSSKTESTDWFAIALSVVFLTLGPLLLWAAFDLPGSTRWKADLQLPLSSGGLILAGLGAMQLLRATWRRWKVIAWLPLLFVLTGLGLAGRWLIDVAFS